MMEEQEAAETPTLNYAQPVGQRYRVYPARALCMLVGSICAVDMATTSLVGYEHEMSRLFNRSPEWLATEGVLVIVALVTSLIEAERAIRAAPSRWRLGVLYLCCLMLSSVALVLFFWLRVIPLW